MDDEARLAARRAIAINVTELRIAHGWSQAELARRSAVPETEVADVEAAVGEMFIDTLSLIAGGLNVGRTVCTDLCRWQAITTLDLETDQSRL